MIFARVAAVFFLVISVMLFTFGIVFAQNQCAGGAAKINCAVNGAISYVCPEDCPAQQKDNVSGGQQQGEANASTEGDKSKEKALECDKVNLTGLLGGITTCWKEGIRGGKEEKACAVKGVTCQSLRKQAEDIMKYGQSNVGEQGLPGSQSGATDLGGALERGPQIRQAVYDEYKATGGELSYQDFFNQPSQSNWTPSPELESAINQAGQELSQMLDYLGQTDNLPANLQNNAAFQQLNDFFKPLDLSMTPEMFQQFDAARGIDTPDWIARASANMANEWLGKVNPDTPYYTADGESTFGEQGLTSGGPNTPAVGSPAPTSLFGRAMAAIQEWYDQNIAEPLANFFSPPPPPESVTFPEAPETTITTEFPSSDAILDEMDMLPSPEAIGQQFAGTNPDAIQGKNFLDSILNKQAAGQAVDEAEAAAAAAIAERMQAQAQEAYDNRSGIARMLEAVGFQSKEEIALAEANMRLNAIREGPVKPLDLGAEAVKISPDSTADNIKFVTAGLSGQSGEQLQATWNKAYEAGKFAYDSATTPWGPGNPTYDALNGPGAEYAAPIVAEGSFQDQGLPGARTGDVTPRGLGTFGTQSGLSADRTGGVPVGSDAANLKAGIRGSPSGPTTRVPGQGLPGANTGAPVGSRTGLENS